MIYARSLVLIRILRLDTILLMDFEKGVIQDLCIGMIPMQHSFSLSEKSQEHKYTSTFFDPKEDLSENFFE